MIFLARAIEGSHAAVAKMSFEEITYLTAELCFLILQKKIAGP